MFIKQAISELQLILLYLSLIFEIGICPNHFKIGVVKPLHISVDKDFLVFTEYVKLKKTLSESRKVKFGVPQETVLGPLLLYPNDIQITGLIYKH